jgi:Ca2+/Na+ antiporter
MEKERKNLLISYLCVILLGISAILLISKNQLYFYIGAIIYGVVAVFVIYRRIYHKKKISQNKEKKRK